MSSSKLCVSPPEVLKTPISVPMDRSLMGPGPSNVDERILQATALPTLGHLHPEFCKIMDDVKAGIRYAFQTNNAVTVALSATGHAAMEAVMVNLLEKGDKVLIAKNGIWGERAGEMATRNGAEVCFLNNPPGVPFSLESIGSALKEHRPKLFFITHGESSTGVLQGLEGIGALCHSYDCLLAVDTVASLGGVPLYMDKWEIDALYTGSQKVLGVPPGVAPISFGDRAIAKLKSRKSPPQSYYLDMNLIGHYWNCFPDLPTPRMYHHTGPVNSIYGLREGLAMLAEEGLEKCWQRHRLCADRLYQGLSALGLELFVESAAARLPTVTTIKVPEGIDWKAVTGFAMKNHHVELAGGLGPTAGKVFRIGVMGKNAKLENVEKALKALEEGLKHAKAEGRL